MPSSGPAARAPADAIRRGAAGPGGLWSQSISGDLPIVLLRIDDIEDLAMVRQLLQAHEYLGIKRLSVDLVILNERGASYVQDLQMALKAGCLAASEVISHIGARPVRDLEQMAIEHGIRLDRLVDA